jgi:sec-independent protein translocase protein TatC
MATNRLDEPDILAPLFSDNDDDEGELAGSSMTLLEHLEELRWRLVKSIAAIVVMSIIAFVFRNYVIWFLTLPLPGKQADVYGGRLIVTGIMEGFTTFLLISIAAGFILALPVVLYQTWAFISPGLYEREKKYAVPFIFIGIALFVAGVALGYIVIRYPVYWLITFAASSFTELITAGSYFTFVAFFMLAFGVVFEIPLVLTFLSKIGLVSATTLQKKRVPAHIGMWIAATFLTPGADPYSPIFLGVAMSFLFELTIIFIRIFNKRTEEAAAEA